MHECLYCLQVCTCDIEDVWNDTPDDCIGCGRCRARIVNEYRESLSSGTTKIVFLEPFEYDGIRCEPGDVGVLRQVLDGGWISVTAKQVNWLCKIGEVMPLGELPP